MMTARFYVAYMRYKCSFPKARVSTTPTVVLKTDMQSVTPVPLR